MRTTTLNFYYFLKYMELLYLIVWTGVCGGSAIWLISAITDQTEVTDSDIHCIVSVSASVFLIAFQLFYNTLLINLRLLAKMRCVTFGLCLFDCLNWMICFCCIRKFCQDRLNSFFTLIKWILYSVVIVYAIV